MILYAVHTFKTKFLRKKSQYTTAVSYFGKKCIKSNISSFAYYTIMHLLYSSAFSHFQFENIDSAESCSFAKLLYLYLNTQSVFLLISR